MNAYRLLKSFALAAAVFAAAGASAADEPLRVVTTYPDLASVVRAVGGNEVQVDSLSDGADDPHEVVPTPSRMLKARKADLLFKVGLDLEIWLDPLLEGARNPKVNPGQPGHVDLSKGLRILEIPAVLDRAQGDVHPYGNPHVWLDPLNICKMADTITDALSRERPAAAEGFRKRRGEFQHKLDEALYGKALLDAVGEDRLCDQLNSQGWEQFIARKTSGGKPYAELLGGWLKLMEPARGKEAVEYHKSLAYFANRFGLKVIGSIEPKPGIPPTARHVQELTDLMKERHVPLIIVAPFYETKYPRRLAEQTGAKLLVLPQSVGGEKGIEDYFQFMDYLTRKVSQALKGGG